MIRYTLKCENEHVFESWFQSAEAFEKLVAAGMATCAVCGTPKIDKTLMSPQVQPARSAAQPPAASAPGTDVAQPLSTPSSPAEAAIAKLRETVEQNSDYVGTNFAEEARSMHEGTAPERAIYGEARPEDARALVDDGVPVLPLPFRPKTQAN